MSQTNLIAALSALLDAIEYALPTKEAAAQAQFLASEWIRVKGRMAEGYLPLTLIAKGRFAQPVVQQAYMSLTNY